MQVDSGSQSCNPKTGHWWGACDGDSVVARLTANETRQVAGDEVAVRRYLSAIPHLPSLES